MLGGVGKGLTLQELSPLSGCGWQMHEFWGRQMVPSSVPLWLVVC